MNVVSIAKFIGLFMVGFGIGQLIKYAIRDEQPTVAVAPDVAPTYMIKQYSGTGNAGVWVTDEIEIADGYTKFTDKVTGKSRAIQGGVIQVEGLTDEEKQLYREVQELRRELQRPRPMPVPQQESEQSPI